MVTAPPPQSELSRDVKRALLEDVGSGDRTAALIAEDRQGRATVITREAAVLCGRPWFDEVFHELDPGVVVTWQADEGGLLEPGQLLCGLEGRARALLTGERTALNFLQTLSGTATVTRRYAEAIAGLPCQVLDTRKTIPGLRRAQKYAVRCGGGRNHRIGLFDGILIKENHIVAAGSISAAVSAAKQQRSRIPIEVEVESLQELRQALDASADMALLDEFSLDDLRTAVELNRAHENGPIKLEASGGVSFESLREIAETGVDFISVGALTKHVRAIDLSMRFQFD